MVVTPISWLHISDFHFRAVGDGFSQDQVCRALLQSIRSVVQDLEAPLAFVAVTGDLAFSGLPAEYARARDFLDELVTIAGIDPSRFYFVPGNHDVDRHLQELAYHGGRARIDSPAQVDHFLADIYRIAPLIERQSAFWSFVAEYTVGQQRIDTDDGLGYVARLDLDRPTICLLGLNSAWLSGADDEERKLVIGERHIVNAVDMARELDPHLIIALAHHPVAGMTEWDAVSCNMRLLPAVDLYLRGHLHDPQVSLSSSPNTPCIEIAVGASHASRFHRNSYNITMIDFSSGLCKIQSYQFLPSSAQFDKCEPESAHVAFRGSIPGTRAELAEGIALAVPSAKLFGDFMAGLLIGQLSEVPILVGGSVTFMAPSVAPEFADEGSLAPMNAFLGLRNLLCLYDRTASLGLRIVDNTAIIRQYAAMIAQMISEDPECAPRLENVERTPPTAARHRDTRPWSLRLLDDLRWSEDRDQLEFLARGLCDSRDPLVRREATVALVEALMRSDESQKREEAFSMALELASTESASDREIVLAAAAAEINRDDAEAVRLVSGALEAGQNSPELINYTLNLSARVGNRDLRRLAERVSSAATAKGVQ